LAKQDEKELLNNYFSEEKMTTDELSKSIMKIRENNELNKEKILEGKTKTLEKLKLDLHRKMQQMASEFEDNSEIKLVWNSDSEKYCAENR
jgi:hypothetical protein